MRRPTFVVLTLLTTLVATGIHSVPRQPDLLAAQSANQSPQVAFEAASVKANKSGDNSTSVGPRPGGRFIATNAPLALLITMAYQLQGFQVQGVPEWTRTDRFDIVAKLDDNPAPVQSGESDRTMLALRALLADRFKLVAHEETQELPIYALVVARADGKLGPNIHPAAADCAAIRAARLAAARGAGTADPNDQPYACGWGNSGYGRFRFGGNSLSAFAGALANQVGRVVVDRTGVAGNWDLELTFTPERIRQQAPSGGATPDDSNGPSIFTALQEQLGLKLESTKGPVRVLVIDRVEQPSPD